MVFFHFVTDMDFALAYNPVCYHIEAP